MTGDIPVCFQMRKRRIAIKRCADKIGYNISSCSKQTGLNSNPELQIKRHMSPLTHASLLLLGCSRAGQPSP